MKFTRIALALLGASLADAAPTDQAIVAAMKIVESSNYAWSCAMPSVGRALVVREGKTETKGFSVITFVDPQSPMLRQISRLNDGKVVAVFRGAEQFMFQTSDGWKTGNELPPLGPRRRGTKGGADYWISIQAPHEELEIIIGSYAEMHAVKGGVAGTLSDDGARQLLGSTRTPAVTAKGTFAFEINNGVLTRYAVDLTGTLMIGPEGQQVESPPQRRLLITEVKDIGRTTVEVPDEARQKLRG